MSVNRLQIVNPAAVRSTTGNVSALPVFLTKAFGRVGVLSYLLVLDFG